MIQIIELIYIIFCVWLADENAKRIDQDKKIYHAAQGATHIGAGVLFSLLFNWFMLPLILLSARIFFTSALNLFREKPLLYVTPKPSAFTDKFEQKIFGRHGETVFIIYLLLWLTCNAVLIIK